MLHLMDLERNFRLSLSVKAENAILYETLQNIAMPFPQCIHANIAHDDKE